MSKTMTNKRLPAIYFGISFDDISNITKNNLYTLSEHDPETYLCGSVCSIIADTIDNITEFYTARRSRPDKFILCEAYIRNHENIANIICSALSGDALNGIKVIISKTWIINNDNITETTIDKLRQLIILK